MNYSSYLMMKHSDKVNDEVVVEVSKSMKGFGKVVGMLEHLDVDINEDGGVMVEGIGLDKVDILYSD